MVYGWAANFIFGWMMHSPAPPPFLSLLKKSSPSQSVMFAYSSIALKIRGRYTLAPLYLELVHFTSLTFSILQITPLCIGVSEIFSVSVTLHGIYHVLHVWHYSWPFGFKCSVSCSSGQKSCTNLLTSFFFCATHSYFFGLWVLLSVQKSDLSSI